MPGSPECCFVVCPRPGCDLRFPGVEGVLCPLCKTPTRIGAECVPAPGPAHPREAWPLMLLLDNVRSVFNVGSIFRSSDGCGVGKLFLAGITPTPEHRAMNKTALGAEQEVSWSSHKNAVHLAKALVHEGHRLWALERTQESHDLFDASAQRAPESLVLVVGNEVSGVDPGVLAYCERSVHIPMHGKKASLNVASAMAIAGYALCMRGSTR